MKTSIAIFFPLLIATMGISQDNLSEHGGGGFNAKVENCLTNEETVSIELQIQESILKLQQEGIVTKPTLNGLEKVTEFEWPLQQAAGFDQPNYYALVNYVDLDPSTSIQDFNCGSRSYNGHRGIDVSLWPYWWKMMEEHQVEVIAGAPGTIILKQDNNFDQNCSCIGTWNAVYVMHDDGSVAWYGHLKTNSLTDKSVGEQVTTGEYIGVVGSSGCSTNPHLHLEIRDAGNNVIEPFQGNCNQTTTTSWWQEQKPYREPTLNLLMTHSLNPNMNNGFCPEDESPYFETQFNPGAAIKCAAYYQDHLTSDPTNYSIKDPNGTIVSQWTHSSNGNYTYSWWYWTFYHSLDGPQGTWTFEAEFLGETTIHEFKVGIDVAVNDLKSIGLAVQPNPVKKFLHIINDSSKQLEYELININGIKVKTGNSSFKRTSINVENLSEGIYVLQVKNKQGVVQAQEKIVKID